VVDDLDRAGDEAVTALLQPLLEPGRAHPLLVLATAEDPALAERLPGAAVLDLAPLDADGVRAVAGRELIPREWAAALPERPYRVVCTKR
jgi:hypothetical protein